MSSEVMKKGEAKQRIIGSERANGMLGSSEEVLVLGIMRTQDVMDGDGTEQDMYAGIVEIEDERRTEQSND